MLIISAPFCRLCILLSSFCVCECVWIFPPRSSMYFTGSSNLLESPLPNFWDVKEFCSNPYPMNDMELNSLPISLRILGRLQMEVGVCSLWQPLALIFCLIFAPYFTSWAHCPFYTSPIPSFLQIWPKQGGILANIFKRFGGKQRIACIEAQLGEQLETEFQRGVLSPLVILIIGHPSMWYYDRTSCQLPSLPIFFNLL